MASRPLLHRLRRTFPGLLALLALLAGLPAGCSEVEPSPAAAEVERRHNVVLVTLDTTRADRMSAYGYHLPTTPNLERLAGEGIRFDLCIATASVTPVSHASILTGLDPYRHGVRVIAAAEGYRLPDSVPTLAAVLAGLGWSTAAFVSAFPVSEHFGLERGFQSFDNGMAGGEDGPGTPRNAPFRARQQRADLTTDKAIAWVRSAEEPFFLWVHYFDPHDALLLPPLDATQELRGDSPRAPERYDTEIFFMDRELGRLLELLREEGRGERTVVAVTADHGEGLGDHGWHAHRLLYQEQIRVPLILKLPGAPAGREVGELVRTTDLFPTFLDALGARPLPDVDGRSLLPLLAGRNDEPRYAYADQLNLWDERSEVVARRPRDDLLHCVMDRRWKLVYRPLHPEESELFDLESDPGEERNLFAEEPERRAELLARLEALEPFVLEPLGTGEIDAEAADALRQLGYLGDGE